MKWHEQFENPVTFGFSSDNFGHIEWRYQDQEKQWHQTWQPKRKDLVILTKLNAEDKKAVLDEMMVNISLTDLANLSSLVETMMSCLSITSVSSLEAGLSVSGFAPLTPASIKNLSTGLLNLACTNSSIFFCWSSSEEPSLACCTVDTLTYP